MLLKRFYHEGLAQASYLIGCQQTGTALVVDANRDVRAYVEAASQEGLRITHVTETHIHADYLSGSRELARLSGAQLLLSADGGEDWQYAFAASDGARLLHDGDSLMIGNVRIEVVHTPGHTPEHLVFVVTDTPASSRPVGALTGDFIFVGDVGRPDLLERAANVEGTMRASAAQLFASLQRFASGHADYLQLWPGHGSGSACGKSLGAVPQTTLGYERVANWALQLADEATFVEAVLEGQPDPPRYFAMMKKLNRQGPAILGEVGAPPRRDAHELESALSSGVLIDVRLAGEFAAGGVAGSLNIPLKKSFVGWAGWLLPYDRDLYLLTPGDDEAVAREAAKELRMIGLDRVVGWFGADAAERWRQDGRPMAVVQPTTPAEVEQGLRDGDVTLVDVRADSEWNSGHIGGATAIPLGRLPERLAELDRSRPVVAQCQSGSRSAIAASLLIAHGFTDVRNLEGGIKEWIASGRPVEREAAESPV